MPRDTRAALVLLPAVLLAGALAACVGQADPPTGGPTSHRPSPTAGSPSATLGVEDQVSLRIRARVGAEPALGTGSPAVTHVYGVDRGLLVSYRVQNGRGTPVLVADGMPNGETSLTLDDEPDPLRTFVRPDGADGLQLTKRTFPGESDGDFPTTFQARVVQPGASVSGRAFVPFPVTRYNASAPLPARPTTWRLCLGVFTRFDGFTLSEDGATALVRNTAYAGDREQRLLCSAPQPLPRGWDED